MLPAVCQLTGSEADNIKMEDSESCFSFASQTKKGKRKKKKKKEVAVG